MKSSQTPIQKLINFPTHENKSGCLCVYESGDILPFDIRRIFTVSATKNEVRGNHAHKLCSQLLVCLSGKIEVTCFDGFVNTTYQLENMGKGLLIPPGIWASEKYIDEGSILMVLCDQSYDADDYIHDYETFKAQSSLCV